MTVEETAESRRECILQPSEVLYMRLEATAEVSCVLLAVVKASAEASSTTRERGTRQKFRYHVQQEALSHFIVALWLRVQQSSTFKPGLCELPDGVL